MYMVIVMLLFKLVKERIKKELNVQATNLISKRTIYVNRQLFKTGKPFFSKAYYAFRSNYVIEHIRQHTIFQKGRWTKRGQRLRLGWSCHVELMSCTTIPFCCSELRSIWFSCLSSSICWRSMSLSTEMRSKSFILSPICAFAERNSFMWSHAFAKIPPLLWERKSLEVNTKS